MLSVDSEKKVPLPGHEPLLPDSEDDTLANEFEEPRRRRSSPRAKFLKLLPYLVHIILITVYSSIFLVLWRRGTTDQDALGIPWVQKVYEMNPKLNESTARLYLGAPTEELDESWSSLLQYSNIRISEEEIRHLDRLDQSVRFTDGSGYFAQMTVYHHLHCIKKIHHFLYLDHYWPNITSDDLALLRAHNYHCLDTIRQAIMCQGDTSLITFRWGHEQPVPLGNFSSPHQCRDWEALDAWNAERHVNVFEPGLVVHPQLGPAYAHLSDGEDVGVAVDH
ncbi:hypothetical protein BDY21DRAFT_18614 [Lineolata rhizophorae]|uniref:Tat pathway signal sequence n=1 Tax=Lineolata rhizophorae TaxID=578093 RepID=A0A6A6P271_9PEZI|nr:hypothetical protein BDY21DRAFT_18614 [Lineolata rhizophorae]